MIRDLEGNIVSDKYAGEQQDIFVLSILGTENDGIFIDIGCREPINHSNTALLEKYKWKGIAIDRDNHSDKWNLERPNSKFIQSDALELNYKDVFDQLNIPNFIIDYLSLDLDGDNVAYSALKKVLNSGYEFKIITIEHDAYRGFAEADMKPQRELLKEYGYVLVRQCDIIEDFWVNPKYISKEQYTPFIHCNTMDQYIINGDNKNTHFWKQCVDINHDFTKYYI